MTKRGLATAIATRTGLVSVLEKLPSRPMLCVLAYHRILPADETKYDVNVVAASPEQFHDHLAMLKRRHSVMDPDELLDLLERPSKIRRQRIAITFDDGYRDNYDHAFPALKVHGLRAMFFLPTAFVGTSTLTWWDQIAWMVRNAVHRPIRLRYPHEVSITPDDDRPGAAIKEVLDLVKQPGVDRARFVEALANATGVAAPAEGDERQFISWDEAAEMQRAGMAIGSHTHSHRILTALSADEQREECIKSRAILQEKKLIAADCLAYPVGIRSAFDRTTIEAAREAGYRFCFTNFGGVNEASNIDPYAILRVSVDLASDAGKQLRVRLAYAGLMGREPW